MAYRYYLEALDFKKRLKDYGVEELTSENAVGVSDITDANGDVVYSFTDGDYQIFDFDNDIEESDSNFNNHRLAVIRYVIESNLSVALSNYNDYGTVE